MAVANRQVRDRKIRIAPLQQCAARAMSAAGHPLEFQA